MLRIKSFLLFGSLSFLSALSFYLQKEFTPARLFIHTFLHMVCMLGYHLIILETLIWAGSQIKTDVFKKYLAIIYSLATFSIVFISLASAVTFYFWLVPVNGILIRDFLFHFKHYTEISFPNNTVLVVLGSALISCLALICLYRTSYAILRKIDGKLSVQPNRRRYLVPTLGIILMLLPIGVYNMHVLRPKLKLIKNTIVLHNPVLYPVYLAFRRSQIRSMVAKKEKEMDVIIRPTVKPANQKNLILFTIDALRADYILDDSLREANMPFIDSIIKSKSNIVYANAYANCNYSACGIFALLEGRASGKIEEKGLSLQQYLGNNGYKNYFLLSGSHGGFGYLDIRYGNRLEFYFEGPFSKNYSPDNDELIFEGLEMLGPKQIQRPFFIWFHLMGVHFVSKRSEEFRINRPDDFDLWSKADPENTLRYVNNYNNGVLETDDRFKRLWNYLAGFKLLENTIIVITADHGENLGEHEELGHGSPLTPEQLHIPLVVFDHDLNQKSVNSQFTSQIDIPSILCEQLKLPTPKFWLYAENSDSVLIVSSIENERGIIRKDADDKYQLEVLRNDMLPPYVTYDLPIH